MRKSSIAACLLFLFVFASPRLWPQATPPASPTSESNGTLGQGLGMNTNLGGFWGHVFNREGKPYAGAVIKITFTELGQTQVMVGNTQQLRRKNTTRMSVDETWRLQVKKNGKYSIYGLPNGLFNLSLYNPQGRLLYRYTGEPDVAMNFPINNVDFNLKKLLAPAAELAHLTRAQRLQYRRALRKMQRRKARLDHLNRILRQETRLAAGAHWKMAQALLQSAVKLDARQPLLWQRLGDADMGAHQAVAAVSAYRQSLVLNPQQPVVMISLANALATNGQTAAAERYLRKARNDDPVDAKIVFYNQGVISFNQRNYAAAAKNFGHAVELDPTYARAWFGRGMALLNQSVAAAGQDRPRIQSGTVAAFNRYLTLDPHGPHAAKAQAMLDAIQAELAQNAGH